MIWKPICLLLCLIASVENARILGVFHIPSYSHNIIGKTLLTALAQKGHEITMISPFPLKNPIKNYEDIYLEEVIKYRDEGVIKILMDTQNASVFTKMSVAQDIVTKMADICLNDAKVKTLLASKKTFDLVIMDWVLNEAMLGIANHYKAPVIVLSAIGSSFLTNKITVNSAPYSYVPNPVLIANDEMTFLERVQNTLSLVIVDLYDHFAREPEQELLLRRHFPAAPSIKELIQNISLVFLNSHFSIESPRPYVPNMIQIAGLQIQEPKELEKDLKKFMDEAKEGVLLFSLGGNTRSADLPAEKLNGIIETFKKLPVKVLWKFETDNVPKVPFNVKTGKWFPQPDILAHPNLKVFVTHGGLLSTTEAVYRGVPMVGIPCFADQEVNVKTNVYRGYSTMVPLDDLSEQKLTTAIKEVLDNPKYRDSVKKASMVLRDLPVKQLDNAVFWVEYVLRHRGAPHLQTSALKLTWYQYYLLDVIFVLLGILFIPMFILLKLVKLIRSVVRKKHILVLMGIIFVSMYILLNLLKLICSEVCKKILKRKPGNQKKNK